MKFSVKDKIYFKHKLSRNIIYIHLSGLSTFFTKNVVLRREANLQTPPQGVSPTELSKVKFQVGQVEQKTRSRQPEIGLYFKGMSIFSLSLNEKIIILLFFLLNLDINLSVLSFPKIKLHFILVMENAIQNKYLIQIFLFLFFSSS